MTLPGLQCAPLSALENPLHAPTRQAHWPQVVWSTGATSRSGSLGASLFDNRTQQVVGVLVGSTSSCAAPGRPDYFGRLSAVRPSAFRKAMHNVTLAMHIRLQSYMQPSPQQMGRHALRKRQVTWRHVIRRHGTAGYETTWAPHRSPRLPSQSRLVTRSASYSIISLTEHCYTTRQSTHEPLNLPGDYAERKQHLQIGLAPLIQQCEAHARMGRS